MGSECIKNRKQSNIILFVFMAIFLVKGIFYAVYITPPYAGTAPDDIGHISYIQYLASEKKLPVLFDTSLENTTSESHISYFNYETTNFKKFIVEDERFDEKYGDNWIAQHPPLFYLLMTPIYLLTKLFTNKLYILIIVLRIASIPFGMATILIINKIMNLIQMRSVVKSCILSCFIFFAPMQYFFSNVTNDSLLILLCTLALYVLLKYTIKKEKKYYYLFVICCSLVMLTKYTGALVLLPYVIFFIYKSVRDDGWQETLRLCIKGGLLGGLILAPMLFRNIYLFKEIFPIYDAKDRLYDVSLMQFLKDKKYLDKLYMYILTFIGTRNFVFASALMKTSVAIISAIFAFLHLLKCKRNSYKLFGFNLGIILLFGLYDFFELDLTLCVALTSFIIMVFFILVDDEVSTQKKEFIWFFLTAIAIVFIVFLEQQYRLFCHFNQLRGVQGRYYYIAIFPFLYLIFNILEEFKFKHTKYIPILITSILMVMEVETIVRCLEQW